MDINGGLVMLAQADDIVVMGKTREVDFQTIEKLFEESLSLSMYKRKKKAYDNVEEQSDHKRPVGW